MLLLVHNVHERNIKETGDRHIYWQHKCPNCYLHLCYNFALVLHQNAPVFGQSDTRNVNY